MPGLNIARRASDPFWLSLAAAAILGGTLAVSQLSADHVVVDGLLGDLWVQIDGMWRASLGQAANRDFITPLGPLFYGVYRLVTLVEGPSLAVLVHANLLVGVAAALLAYGIGTRSTARRETVVLLMLLAFLTAASGRAIGTTFMAQAVPYIVPYNRWAWAIALPCAFGLVVGHRGTGRLALTLVGLGLAGLFYIKLSYFVALAGLAVAAFAIDAVSPEKRSESARRAVTLFAATAAFLAIGALLSSPSSYLADVKMVAAANYVAFRLMKFALQCLEAGIAYGLALILYCLASNLQAPKWQDAARILLVVGAGAAIMSQNHENNEAPLYFGALLVAYALGRGREEAEAERGATPTAAPRLGFYLMFLLMLVPMTADAGTAAIARLRAAVQPRPPIAGFEHTPLADLRSNDDMEIPAIQDAVALLAEVGQNGRTVLPLIMGNPLSALTRTPSPRGSMAIWYYGRTFSETHLPAPERAFGDAHFVLVRKHEATSTWLWRLYGAWISSHYRRVGESAHWIAWQRVETQRP